jgi:hypothetical protein
MAMGDDRAAFQSEDPRRREAALNRFYYGYKIYHDIESIMMCLDDLPADGMCHVLPDWNCLAKVAKQVEDQL